MNAQTPAPPLRIGDPSPAIAPGEAPNRPAAGELGAVLYVEHPPGQHNGTWEAADGSGGRVYSVGHGPTGGTRVGVRDGAGTQQTSLGEPVLSLVEHFTIWRAGRPCACVYRPGGGAHRGRWFVEVGDHDGWVVQADRCGMRVFSGGVEVARSVHRDCCGRPMRVELAPGIDAPLVLLVAELLSVPGEFPP